MHARDKMTVRIQNKINSRTAYDSTAVILPDKINVGNGSIDLSERAGTKQMGFGSACASAIFQIVIFRCLSAPSFFRGRFCSPVPVKKLTPLTKLFRGKQGLYFAFAIPY